MRHAAWGLWSDCASMACLVVAHPVTKSAWMAPSFQRSGVLCGAAGTHLAHAVAVMCMTSLASRLSAREPVSGSSSVCVRHGQWVSAALKK